MWARHIQHGTSPNVKNLSVLPALQRSEPECFAWESKHRKRSQRAQCSLEQPLQEVAARGGAEVWKTAPRQASQSPGSHCLQRGCARELKVVINPPQKLPLVKSPEALKDRLQSGNNGVLKMTLDQRGSLAAAHTELKLLVTSKRKGAGMVSVCAVPKDCRCWYAKVHAVRFAP